MHERDVPQNTGQDSIRKDNSMFAEAAAARARYFKELERKEQEAVERKRSRRVSKKTGEQIRAKQFEFNLAGVKYKLQSDTMRFSEFLDQEQLLLVIGSSTDLGFIDSLESQKQYVMAVLNRDRPEEERLTDEAFQQLVNQEIEAAHISQTDDRLQLEGLALETIGPLAIAPIARRCAKAVAGIRASRLAIEQ